MKLTEHFSLEELIASGEAARLEIDNSLPENLVPNIRILAEGLESARRTLGNLPIHVTSGFRCRALNKIIGGASNSWHMKAVAADIVCPEFGSPLEVCKAIAASDIGFEQIIHEFHQWCHIAFPEPGKQPSYQILTIASARTGYRLGLS